MSIKIYHGFKFKGSVTALQTLLSESAESYQKMKTDFWESVIPTNVQMQLSTKLDNENAFDMWDRLEKIMDDADGNLDTNHCVCIRFINDNEAVGILVVNGFDCKEWYDDFFNKPEIEEFGYWDNTDMPDDVTAEEWEERYQTWKPIIDTGFISASTFTFNLLNVERYLSGIMMKYLQEAYLQLEKEKKTDSPV